MILQDPVRVDTSNIAYIDQDSIIVDTTRLRYLRISEDAVEFPVTYTSLDTVYTDMDEQKVYLTNTASVVYGQITLEAYYIEYNMITGEVFARGKIDSVGNWIGLPFFKDGDEEFECRELVYNFKSKRGLIRNIISEQEDGFLHSDVTKRHEDGSLHVKGSKYTTCDAEHPHFYIGLPKAKVMPGEKIVSGPAYLVLQDIPLPLALPFGYFPVQKEVASGIVIPRYGEESNRGYFLKNGGYYFAVSDHFDLKMTGDFYTNGTWRLNTTSNYKKRYKFQGSFGLNYANNVSGNKGLDNYSSSSNYSIRWTHAQDQKARPGTRFAASVNMSSSGFDKENSYNVNDHINTTKQSSVSYTKTWAGTPFNLSASLNHSQNSANQTVNLNLPKLNFSMSRIYPFKNSKSSGPSRWWQELQLSYNASLDNRASSTDGKIFSSEMLEDMRNGFKHEIPISIPIRPFNNFSISPTLRYSGVLFTEQVNKYWDADYYNAESNDTISTLVSDNIKGMTYGHAIKPSISAGYSPQIYGTYSFTNPDSRVIAVRHVMKPSVSFSYVPVIDGLSTEMYRTVQTDTLGNMREYSIYEGAIYSTPRLAGRSSGLSFSLSNIIEAKVRQRNDTTGKEDKVKIIDNLGFSSSYNVFADSLKWSPLSMVMRTTLFNELSVSARGNFDFYSTDSLYRRINTPVWLVDRKPFRLTNFSLSLNFDLSRLIKSFINEDKRADKQASGNDSGNRSLQKPGDIGMGAVNEQGGGQTSVQTGLPYDEFGYVNFKVPWTMRVAYNFYYTKSRDESVINQNITMNGSVTLTSKWSISYSSGYDFRSKDITMTRIGISRDLHCWEMSFNWIPTGYMKSWDFTIRARSSILQDLKYERRKDYHDNY